MSKYIDADKLRAGVERLKEELKNNTQWLGLPAAFWAYCKVLAFIDSLPEEKEIDLDERITEYWKDISSIYGAVGKEITRFDFDDACKYFYELGKHGR